MVIEFSNAVQPKNHTTMAMAIVITALALFFIPTTLIVLGYYSSQPTGSLISPVPQTTLSQTTPTPVPESADLPIIAGPNDNTSSTQANIAPTASSNIIDKTTSISAGVTQSLVHDADVTENSQIYLSPRPGDATVYSLKSKAIGEFTIAVDAPSDILRYIDYHIVNP